MDSGWRGLRPTNAFAHPISPHLVLLEHCETQRATSEYGRGGRALLGSTSNTTDRGGAAGCEWRTRGRGGGARAVSHARVYYHYYH